MTHCRRRAFTLVEMIIVVGIIVCLFTILMPVLSRAREQGKRAECLSNLRQLTTAWLAYAADNGGRLCSPVPGLTRGGWVTQQRASLGLHNGLLWPYLNSERVFVCPADQTINNTKSSFQINGVLAGGIGVPLPIQRLDDIAQAPKTFVFIEGCLPMAAELKGMPFSTPVYPSNVFKLFGFPGQNHMGPSGHAAGTGISFADGHAIFWNYTDARTMNLAEGGGAVAAPNSPDVYQLEAWSGGQVPPNAVQ